MSLAGFFALLMCIVAPVAIHHIILISKNLYDQKIQLQRDKYCVDELNLLRSHLIFSVKTIKTIGFAMLFAGTILIFSGREVHLLWKFVVLLIFILSFIMLFLIYVVGLLRNARLRILEHRYEFQSNKHDRFLILRMLRANSTLLNIIFIELNLAGVLLFLFFFSG